MELDRVTDVVVVAVREQDQVTALGLELRLRAARIAGEERVDVDALPARRVESKSGVPEPGELRRHAPKSRELAPWPDGLPLGHGA
jgi:hypothetical protein